MHFIKTGIVTIEAGRLYADLMDSRQKGDYGDMFDFDEKTVQPLLEPVSAFIKDVRELIEKEEITPHKSP